MARVDIMQRYQNSFNMKYHKGFGETKRRRKIYIRDFQSANDNSSRRTRLLPVLGNFSTYATSINTASNLQ